MITYCFFIWILTQGCFAPKLVEIGSVVLEKRFFLISSMYFRFFCNYLPLEMGWVLYLNILEFPSPYDALWQVWLKLAQWFCRRRFLKVVNLFLFIPNYLPFGKGVALHLNKLESLSTKDTLCPVWLKLAQWFWRRRWKCEKFTDRQMDGRTDDGRQVIRKAHLSFQLRWAKKHALYWPGMLWLRLLLHYIILLKTEAKYMCNGWGLSVLLIALR